jgi:toxin ParE1/3/4
MQLNYSTRAMIEIDEIAGYIQQNNPRAALRFLEAVEATAENLLLFPEFGARFETEIPKLVDLRVCLVRGFEKYLVFYRLSAEIISIERVVLGSRDLPTILREDT